ncbi:MAG: hypothetical protein AB1705_07065 [Verrucomicrobiota bacterium]
MRDSLSAIGPLILRELRVESRRPSTYRLRVGALVVMVIGLIIVAIDKGGLGSGSGAELLTAIHICLVAGIWLTVPVLAADSISREVREGTLGLLLLTPLTPRGIVIGKSLLHTLRAGSLLLSAVPLLGVCVLLGGVSALQITYSIIINASMLCLALAAGLLASVYNERWVRAVFWAFVLTAILVLLYACIFVLLMLLQITQVRTGFVGPIEMIPQVVAYVILGMKAWTPILTGPLTARFHSLGLQLFGLCVLTLVVAISKASARVRALGAGPVPSPQLERVSRTLYKPILFSHWFRARMLKLLEVNPVAWLQQRLPQARAAKWGICFGAVTWLGFNADDIVNGSIDEEAVVGLFAAFTALLALASASSFRGERESGAFELLLVTPLTEQRILKGRLFGIYWLFLPTLIASLAFLGCAESNFSRMGWLGFLFLFWVPVGTYIDVPLIGVNASLGLKSVLRAWFITCLFAFVCALSHALMFGVMTILFENHIRNIGPPPLFAVLWINLGMLLWNVFLAGFLWRLLLRGLTRRAFTPALA